MYNDANTDTVEAGNTFFLPFLEKVSGETQHQLFSPVILFSFLCPSKMIDFLEEMYSVVGGELPLPYVDFNVHDKQL